MNGLLVSRDGDPREGIEGNARRRTFKVDGMENVQVLA
jgi:hypothetical protein